jgi:hypothetical protein
MDCKPCMFSYRAAVLQTHVTEQQENSISVRLTFIEWDDSRPGQNAFLLPSA